MKKASLIIFSIATLFLIVGAGKKDKDGNFYKDYKGYVFVPMGSAMLNDKTVSVPAFFLSECEITNGQYNEFLADLKAQGKMADYEIAKINTALWNSVDVYGAGTNAKNYHLQKDFPVVNISKRGAQLYCLWLTEKYRENSKAEFVPEFRLPTKWEWEFAATSGKGTQERPYPWGGPYCRNSKGCYLAQFKALGQELGPVEVKEYKANELGLYNMSGNVAEMIAEEGITKGGHWYSNEEKLMIVADDEYKVSPFVGFRPAVSFLGKRVDKKD